MPQNQSGVPTNVSIDEACAHLSEAANALQAQSNNTGDPNKLEQINAQCDAIRDCMNSILQTKLAMDQMAFEQAAGVFKAQATTLQGMEAKIRTLIDDEAELSKIVGYITKAIPLLACA